MKTYTIKTLEWTKWQDGWNWANPVPTAVFFVGFRNGALRWGFQEPGRGEMEYRECGSIEQGKAAAGDAWVDYVEQFLNEVTPS